jgi:hypothetical protein
VSIAAHSAAGDFTTSISTGSASAVLNKPANVADGDLLVAFIYNQTSGGTVTPPAGWALLSADFSSPRTCGWYYKPIPSAAAETATSYTFTFSVSARNVNVLFRVTGADLTNPVDVVSSTQATYSSASATAASITTTRDGSLVLCGTFINDSTAQTGTFTQPSGYTDIYQGQTPSGSTSAIDVSAIVATTAGASGTATVTRSYTPVNGHAWLVAIAALPVRTASVPVAISVDVSLVIPGAKTATIPVAVAVTAAVTPATPVQAWLRDTVPMAAHRGGSADWPEETLYAYGQAAAWSPRLALEISVWQSSDGVWVCSHDQTTARVFGTSYDIPTTPWSTLSTLRTTVGNQPIARLDAVLAAYASGNRVLFIDNKGNQNPTALYVLLDSYGGNTRFVIKSFQSGTSIGAAAHARGYTTWGYYYEADVPSLPSTQASWDLLGMDYTASGAAWASVLSYGKPVLGHIIPDAAGKTTALGKGANGLMVSGVLEAVPQVGAGAMIPVVVGVTVGVTPSRTATASVPVSVRTVVVVAGTGGTTLVRDITITPGPALTRYAAGPATT